MGINWKESPEGFSIWLEDISETRKDNDRSCWAREGRGEYDFASGGYWSYSAAGTQYVAHKPFKGELK